MKGTAKVKDDSTYVYAGFTFDVIGVYEFHNEKELDDIYPVGSITYKLSLKGTEWDEWGYTVIHDSHLENIQVEGTIEANVWYNGLGADGEKVVNSLFNKDGNQSIDDMYNAYHEQLKESAKDSINESDKPILTDDDGEPYLAVFDIRNKLSPITFLINLYENPELQEKFPGALDKAKRKVNYLAGREVYELE
jgi:hypothetical protein